MYNMLSRPFRSPWGEERLRKRRNVSVPPADPSRPLRVLHICATLSGGVASVLMNYYRHIDRSVVQFDFLTHVEPDAAVRAEVEGLGGMINVITPKSESLRRNIQDAWVFINSGTPHQVIQLHNASPTYIVYLAIAWMSGKRVRITHSHTTGLEPSAKWLYQVFRILQPALRALTTDRMACSLAAGRWLFGDSHFSAAQVVPNAIELERFRFDPTDRELVRRELRLTDRLVVGHVGRIAEVKNHEFLVRVFRELVRREPRAALLLVGEGPLLGDVQRQVSEAGLAESVFFLGSRDDVPALLSAMDVLVLPSRFEGLGLVLVEAQASGLPCLASTEVPREVALTPLVQFESLSESPQVWADQVLGLTGQPRERVLGNEIADAGYDISRAASSLTDFYLRSVVGRPAREAGDPSGKPGADEQPQSGPRRGA